jgi:hypothetical protein
MKIFKVARKGSIHKYNIKPGKEKRIVAVCTHFVVATHVEIRRV